MKRISGFIGVLILVIILAGCSGGTESTRTFVLERDGVTTTMDYIFKGDKVKKQTTENIIDYALVGLASKEEAKQLFDPLIQEFQNIKGLTHEMVYEDSKAIESLIVNYEEVNFEEIQNLQGMSFDTDADIKGISMKKSAELLESQGFTEVK